MLDVDTIGISKVNSQLQQSAQDVNLGTIEGGRAAAEALLYEIKLTAPRDSGRYRNDWRIEERPNDDRGDLFIVNSVDYARYLVFPNRKMRGSPTADDPGRGIQHNVRGIVKKHQKDAQQSFIEAIREALFG